MNRGRGRQIIFHNDTYDKAFLDCLEQVYVRFNLEIFARRFYVGHHFPVSRTIGRLREELE